jgi:serine protease inhibitor
VLSLANSIFIYDNVKDKINENYVTNIHEKYNAEVKYDSFKNAENINKWIEDKTMGTIKKMVKDEDLVNAKYTLVNALAIDMEWQYDIFSEEECLFNYTDEQSAFVKSVDASVHNENILYSSNDDVISVTVPMKKYDNFQFEYIAIMPKNSPLKDYINTVTSNDINNIVDSQIPTSSDAEIDNVNITLPVYNYDYSLNLDDSLKALGIKTLYNHPDLSNISDIDIGEIRTLHKADISFSKKGTKAAASTAIIAIELCCEPIETNDIYLTFDKPYMYIIRDKDTHEIWFVGTVYEPETSK